MKNVKNKLEKLKGVQTVESVATLLNVSREKAIKYIYNLRKKGYVKTKRLSNNKRVYDISFENRLGGKGYLEVLNENSPIKLNIKESYRIHGKEPSLEEALVFAIESKSLRRIMASLALFKKIKDWALLYQLSKSNEINRQVGALYDLSKSLMKTRKMAKRFINLSLPNKDTKYIYLIEGLSSKDFNEIERKWKVYLPFNKADLEEYKKESKR